MSPVWIKMDKTAHFYTVLQMMVHLIMKQQKVNLYELVRLFIWTWKTLNIRVYKWMKKRQNGQADERSALRTAEEIQIGAWDE